MHAADPLGVRGLGGDRGDRQGGGVRRQHGVVAAGILEPAEQAALQLDVLGRRLDHEGAGAEVVEAGGGADPRRGRLGLGGGPALAFGAAVEVCAQPFETALERLACGS